jgi:hypothetical protein
MSSRIDNSFVLMNFLSITKLRIIGLLVDGESVLASGSVENAHDVCKTGSEFSQTAQHFGGKMNPARRIKGRRRSRKLRLGDTVYLGVGGPAGGESRWWTRGLPRRSEAERGHTDRSELRAWIRSQVFPNGSFSERQRAIKKDLILVDCLIATATFVVAINGFTRTQLALLCVIKTVRRCNVQRGSISENGNGSLRSVTGKRRAGRR